ncbi:hypothetical protein O3Q51_05160 [Cryomorphaceae bacterium 1068]|nr:hypothetical protein [Cryomorphaceae bacterium 1068]
MKKYNRLELIGFALLVIGTLFWLSEEYFLIESLVSVYTIAQFVFWIGLFIWALGYMLREKEQKDQPKVN